MGKHVTKKNKRKKGTGTRGNSGPFSLQAAQKAYDALDARTQRSYTRPGSIKKHPTTVTTKDGTRRVVHG